MTASFSSWLTSCVLLCGQIHRQRSQQGNLPGQIRNLQKVTDPQHTRNAFTALTQHPTVARCLYIPFIPSHLTAHPQSATGSRIGLLGRGRGSGGGRRPEVGQQARVEVAEAAGASGAVGAGTSRTGEVMVWPPQVSQASPHKYDVALGWAGAGGVVWQSVGGIFVCRTMAISLALCACLMRVSLPLCDRIDVTRLSHICML
jgi:hypothetical protein